MGIQWRIYYDDFSTFDSNNGEPEDAPAWGVICINQPDPKTNVMRMHRWDYYYWHRKYGQWWGSNLIGMVDQFATYPRDVVALKVGRNADNAVFQAITDMAIADNDFLERSAGANPLEYDYP